jgi:hypothetical protein
MRELGGKTYTFHYSGKVSAETIKGKTESGSGAQTESREWEARRQTEKK